MTRSPTGARPVIYKSTALARTAPGLAAGNDAVRASKRVRAASERADAVREAFKASRLEEVGIPAAPTEDGDEADAVRHKRRVALNRSSAASSRLRREAYVSALESELAHAELYVDDVEAKFEVAQAEFDAQLAEKDAKMAVYEARMAVLERERSRGQDDDIKTADSIITGTKDVGKDGLLRTDHVPSLNPVDEKEEEHGGDDDKVEVDVIKEEPPQHSAPSTLGPHCVLGGIGSPDHDAWLECLGDDDPGLNFKMLGDLESVDPDLCAEIQALIDAANVPLPILPDRTVLGL
jgi:hypothetical protein